LADIENLSMRDIVARSMIDIGSNTYVQRVSGSLSIGGARTKLQASQDLSLAPFSYTTALTDDFILRGILIHSTAPITETITITYDESSGTNYDTVFLSDDLTLNSNWSYFPDSSYYVFASSGDKLTIEVSNDTTPTATVYVTLLVEVI
jgi:hypothetical protein